MKRDDQPCPRCAKTVCICRTPMVPHDSLPLGPEVAGPGFGGVTFHGKPIDWAHDPNSCDVCKAFVASAADYCARCADGMACDDHPDLSVPEKYRS